MPYTRIWRSPYNSLMTDFLFHQQDYIRCFYGIALIIMAAACFVIKRQEEDKIPWYLLVLFGFLHGLHEWLEIMKPLSGESAFFEFANSALIIVSFLFLFEFGRLGLSRDQVKVPGRWIFLPLLFLAAGVALATGWDGLDDAAGLILLFPGGLLGAWVLFLAARPIQGWPRYLLAAAGLMLAFYVVLTVLMAMLPYMGISLLKNRLIMQRLELVYDLIKASLSLGIAFAISQYSQLSASRDVALRYFALRSKLVFWISVFAMIAIITNGWFLTQYLGRLAMMETSARADANLDILQDGFDYLLAATHQNVKGLAELPLARDTLAMRGARRLGAEQALDDYRISLNLDDCYLFDERGQVISASTSAAPGSVVGQDYVNHPYIKKSIEGLRGSFFAFGLATEKRGYFASVPVYSKRGKVIGVAVVKKNLDAVELNFLKQEGIALLLSPEGIIYVAGDARLVGMSLWPLDNNTVAALSVSQQFGPGPFRALLPQEPENNGDAALNNDRYFVKRRVVNSAGWTIALLKPIQTVISYRIFGIVIVMLFCVVMICFFVMIEKSLASAAQIAVTENRFRVLFEGAPGAIFIIDNDTRKIISANPFMNDWLNYSPEEVLSLTLSDIRVAEAGQAPGECRYRKRGGDLIDVMEVHQEIFFQGRMADLIIAHDISDRKKAEELLYTLSMADGLTGIANRRRFNDFLTQEWRRAIRDRSEISLIMCDIDFFKNYNDTYGHQAGDDCLKQVAEAISQTFHRPGDMAARYGGEEFAVIMSGTGLHDALAMAQAVRAAVEALGIPHGSSTVVPVVTLSLGVAAIKPQKEISFDVLVAAADQALYHAKSRGRNQVQVSVV